MKTLGLLGGMSWESTLSYYSGLNLGVKQRLGGLHSARLILNSVDFAGIEALQHRGDWDTLASQLSEAACAIERAGAEALLICTNTMHKVAPQIESTIGIPLLHLADATAAVARQRGYHTVGLLGTAFTMEQAFYRGRLEQAGLTVLIPEPAGRAEVHRVIYEELCCGVIEPRSRDFYLSCIESLKQSGAEAVILGCTEIGLLVQQSHCELPLLDTTAIHIEAALDFALAGSKPGN